MYAEILRTDRLLLRPWAEQDARFLYSMNADPLVLEFTGDQAFESILEASSFIQSYTHYQINGFGRWLVVRLEDGAKLGWCGLRRPELRLEVDLGFRFACEYWGQGYASEAAAACLTFGHRELALPEIIARTHRSNLRSQKVLERIGMSFEGDCSFGSDPGYWFRSSYPA